MSAAAMLVALGIDWRFGWPDVLFRRIGHPVTWIGRLLTSLDLRFNRAGDGRERRIAAGMVCALITIGVSILAAALIASLLPGGWPGILLTGLFAAPLVAAKGLDQHVAAVFTPLGQGRLAEARAAVAMIVGRDPARLDAAGISRAALESLAENASDGVTAPLFWGAVLGLPGIAAYKAINTLDSMIGHRTPRHEAFGRFAARLDDVANWIPARLTGLVFCAVAPRPRAAFAVMRRDARAHRSPNAGWPEAALAGALGIRLSGPRIYHDRIAEEPWLNPGAPDPGPAEGAQALALYRRAMALLAILLALIAFA